MAMHVVVPWSLCCRLITSVTSQTRPTRARREGTPSCVPGTPSTQQTAGSLAWCNVLRLVLPGDVVGREPGWRQLGILLNACCCEREWVRERTSHVHDRRQAQAARWMVDVHRTDASTLKPHVPGPRSLPCSLAPLLLVSISFVLARSPPLPMFASPNESLCLSVVRWNAPICLFNDESNKTAAGSYARGITSNLLSKFHYGCNKWDH
jgi:hypothetical protein